MYVANWDNDELVTLDPVPAYSDSRVRGPNLAVR